MLVPAATELRRESLAPWIKVKPASNSITGPLTTSTQRKGIASRSSAFTVSAGILLSRVIGLVRERVFAHYFGNSDAADAFRGAFRIPNFLQTLFGEGVLSASFIPVYARLRAEERHEEATQLAEAIFAILFLDRVAADTGRSLRCPLADRRNRARFPAARRACSPSDWCRSCFPARRCLSFRHGASAS